MSAHKLVPCHPSHWTLAQMAKALSFHISIFSQGFSSKANLVTSEGFILKYNFRYSPRLFFAPKKKYWVFYRWEYGTTIAVHVSGDNCSAMIISPFVKIALSWVKSIFHLSVRRHDEQGFVLVLQIVFRTTDEAPVRRSHHPRGPDGRRRYPGKFHMPQALCRQTYKSRNLNEYLLFIYSVES